MAERAREHELDPPAEAARRRAPEDARLAGAPARLLALQRTAGNQAVTALLQRAGNELAIPPGLSCEPATDSPATATEVMLFPNAVSALTPEQRGLLDNVAANWNAAGDQPAVRVDGYASTPGEDADNWKLACERASGVTDALENPSSGDPGIPASAIESFMHGETTEFGAEAQNRRASIYVAPSQPAATPATPAAGPVTSPWWPDGPTVPRKQKATPIGQYVTWLREVETAYGGDRSEVVHRMRRLYYSSHVATAPKGMNPSGSAGPKFDQLIAGNDSPPPLTSPPLSLTALNGLFETDTIQTVAGESLDPTHIFAALDLELQGASTLGGGLEVVSGSPLTGVFTWTGDLGSWFIDWIDQKKLKPGDDDIALLLSRVNSKVSLDDLLSDMDAQVMVKDEVTTTITTTPTPVIGIEPDVSIESTLDRPLSEILDSWYGKPAAGGGAAPASNPAQQRFVRFVKSAVPRIPHETPDPSKPDEIRLAGDAEEALYDAIYATCETFLEGSNTLTRIGTPDALEDNEHVVHEIARRFHAFLEAGLATGNAPWP
jgi:outer membrane protein OmpA-like peptidoglycan-associated protein